MRPVCDFLQTIPLFAFLIPVLMSFQIGEFSAFLAVCAYAVVPMIRYTHHDLTSTQEDLIEAVVASGANEWQAMREVRIPYSAATILIGLNQTILYAFSMLVIESLIGTTDLGSKSIPLLARAMERGSRIDGNTCAGNRPPHPGLRGKAAPRPWENGYCEGFNLKLRDELTNCEIFYTLK